MKMYSLDVGFLVSEIMTPYKKILEFHLSMLYAVYFVVVRCLNVV